jgi:hypothetical protein
MESSRRELDHMARECRRGSGNFVEIVEKDSLNLPGKMREDLFQVGSSCIRP